MKNQEFKDDLRAKLALDDETIKGDISNIKKVVKFVVFGGCFFLAGCLTSVYNMKKIPDVKDFSKPVYYSKSLCEVEQKTCMKTIVFMWTKKQEK